jgi:hypothetical protein
LSINKDGILFFAARFKTFAFGLLQTISAIVTLLFLKKSITLWALVPSPEAKMAIFFIFNRVDKPTNFFFAVK